MFHMGWFVGQGFSAGSWADPWAGDRVSTWMKPDLYVDLARAMDRSGFDYLMLEDGSLIPDVYNGSTEASLRWGLTAPKNDPVTLVPLLGQATKNLGIVATITTSFYPPFLAARLLASLDHITDGRVGANLVTAHNDRAAQNYGLPGLLGHDDRYRMAAEWVDVVTQLFGSWEEGAYLGDLEEPRLVDFEKVHPIDFEGEFFRSRGPLNTVPGPQGRPVICQAGGSPAGQDFAARYADTIIGGNQTVESMKEYCAGIRARMVENGRDPSECKVLFVATPVVAETTEEARAKLDRSTARRASRIDAQLAGMSYISQIDFGKFDLDAPIPDDLETDGAKSVLTDLKRRLAGKTLREYLESPTSSEKGALVGTPDAVASQMADLIDETGADGFLLGNGIERREVAEITDGLMPELRRRGCVREEYTGSTFRENLLAF